LGLFHQNYRTWCPDLKSRRTLGIRFTSAPPKGHGCSVERAAGLHPCCSIVTPKSPEIAARTSAGLTWFDEVAGRPRPRVGLAPQLRRTALLDPVAPLRCPEGPLCIAVSRTAQLAEACVEVLPGGFRSRAPKCAFARPGGSAPLSRRTASLRRGTRSAAPKNRLARPDGSAPPSRRTASLHRGTRSAAPKNYFARPGVVPLHCPEGLRHFTVGLARQLRRTTSLDPVGVIAPEHKCSVARPWVQPFRSRRTVGPLPGLRG